MSRWLDLSYGVSGANLARDYPQPLYRALLQVAPWLEDEPHAGVHPLRGLTPCADSLLIGGRAQLVLRVPLGRAGACGSLPGRTLALPQPIQLGALRARDLLAYPVLHARLVVTGAEDEAQFAADVARALAELGLICETIIGRRSALQLANRQTTGFSLMLHGLSAADSLLAQTHGIGRHRKLGCGLFIPHKSVAAVGG